MSSTLSSLYAEWRRLTESERSAISDARWSDLGEAQETKRSLQRKILLATDAWRTSAKSVAIWRQEHEATFRPVVGELIRLETENQRLLNERCAEVHRGLGDVECTQRRLSGVRRAYGGRGSTGWRTYS